MLHLPDTHGIVLMIAENLRYAPDIARVRHWVRCGLIGKPFLMHWEAVSAFDPQNAYWHTAWRQKPLHPGGSISDSGVHYVDVFRSIGGEIEKVQAFVSATRPLLGSYDTLAMNMLLEGGVAGQLTMSFAATDSAITGLEVFGEEGTATARRGETILSRPGHAAEVHRERTTGGYLEELLDFHAAVTEGKTPEVSLRDAYIDFAVTVAALKSAETAQVIDMRDFLHAAGGLHQDEGDSD